MIERGAGGDSGPPAADRAEPSVDRATEPVRSGAKDDGPSERRASNRAEGRGADKAGDAGKSEKRARASDGDRAKPSEKAARAADKANEKQDKADAKADAAREAKQSDAKRHDKAETPEPAKQAEIKPSADKPGRHVELTQAKRDDLRGAFRKEKDLKPRAHVDVDISIGRRLPRDWDYRPVPIAVIEIVPEYRDYVFVYAEDEYVICDPDTFEVVAVVPAGGAEYAAGGGSDHCPARLSLSRDERELILDEARMNDEVDVRDLQIGWSVPSDVELQRFPDRVVSEADELAACRYFVAKDQLAIVDPIEEKVILVIDKG